MGLLIRLAQERRSGNKNYGKIYGQVKNKKPIGIDEMADHMAHHNTPFSKGVIRGILKDFVDCTKEMLLEGQPVKIADLGIFYAKASSKPANTVEDFDLNTNIKCIRLLCTPSGETGTKVLTSEATLEYTDLAKKIKAGLVDISSLYEEDTTPSGGDDSDPDDERP